MTVWVYGILNVVPPVYLKAGVTLSNSTGTTNCSLRNSRSEPSIIPLRMAGST